MSGSNQNLRAGNSNTRETQNKLTAENKKELISFNNQSCNEISEEVEE